jgi:hypothetical protein
MAPAIGLRKQNSGRQSFEFILCDENNSDSNAICGNYDFLVEDLTIDGAI